MRIAQVITLYPPDFVGGATLACARLAGALRERGHEVSVFCGSPDPALPQYVERPHEVEGVPVTAVPVATGYVPLAEAGWRHPEVEAPFARFLDRTRPDVLHVHSIQALGANLLAVAAARALPLVVTMHDWWWFCARLFLVDPHDYVCPQRVASARCHCAPEADLAGRRRFLDAMLTHAALVTTPSRLLADAAVANGVPRARVRVVPNAVARPPRPAAPRPGPVRFGYLGGPDNRLKGLPTLLAAAAVLDVGGWTLALHGAAGAAVDAAVADRVRTLPAFPPAALDAVLGALDCVLVPSLMRESSSLVTREALAAGVPVIATDCGGPREVLRPGVNGLVVATGDAGDLAAAMRRVVLEPALREVLRAGARATAVPDLAGHAAALEAVYAEAAAGAPGAAVAPSSSPARPVPGRVLFVAGADGAPHRYRVANLAAQLRAAGVATRALAATDPALPAAIDACDLVIAYRVPWDSWVEAWLGHARARGRHVVFSCDDLLFDREATPHAALALLPEAQRRWWLDATPRYAATLARADAFLGSTEPLVAAAARLGVPGVVARNGLGDAQLTAAEAARLAAWRAHAGAAPAHRRLVYSSGSTMHDHDFAVAAPALASVLAARPDARLRLIGPLHVPAVLAAVAGQIERVPFVTWRDLPTLLADADVNLAPLAAGAFADAKSEVKYLEAAAVGVPTIATPTAAFRYAIQDGENGRHAADAAAWERALATLLDDGGLRRRLGNAARDDVARRYAPEVQGPDLLAALAAVTATAPRADGAAALADAAAPAVLAARFPAAGRADLEPGDAVPGPAQLVRDTPSPFLAPGRAGGQRGSADGATLERADVAVGTDGIRRVPRLTLAIAEAPGAAVLRRATVAGEALADGGWIAFAFTPLPTRPGQPLYLWVEGDGDPVTLWTCTDAAGAPVPDGLHLDHRPAPGALAYRTFAALTPPGASPSPSRSRP